MKPRPLFDRIKAALDSEDIEDLLELGSPTDEYESEASLIEAKLMHLGSTPLSEAQVERIIAEVWNDQFGPFNDEDLRKRRPSFISAARKVAHS